MDESNKKPNYFFLAFSKNQGGYFDNLNLSLFRERHKIDFFSITDQLTENFLNTLLQDKPQGIVIEMYRGNPSLSELKLAKVFLKNGITIWFYWAAEKVIEFIDKEKLNSYLRHWIFIKVIQYYRFSKERIKHFLRATRSLLVLIKNKKEKENLEYVPYSVKPYYEELNEFYSSLVEQTNSNVDFSDKSIAYLRLDFWARIKTGGSYGHTCYVANELNKLSPVLAIMPNRFDLLDTMGVKQIQLDNAGDGYEENLILANNYYYSRLKPLIEYMKPAFIYERICLGNYVGARLSKNFNIPYIVEYNGSEISMMRSFGSSSYQYEDYYLKAEEAAFKQANIISVVSQVIANDLIERGVLAEKILVNPNGADPEVYKPATDTEKLVLRKKYKWEEKHIVIGFVGTFGGWHGIDVLASSIPSICAANDNIRFLLIGDGNYKHLIETTIKEYKLDNKVILTGLVPQSDTVNLLRMCDVYVSPHSNHMNDSPFFGSPTKLFEYMSLAGGIVASNLMQIGEILSPGIMAEHLNDFNKTVSNERAILCRPGNVTDFTEAVVFLSNHIHISKALGENARKALIEHYSWKKHIERLTHFTQGSAVKMPAFANCSLNDAYKAEVQKQWDNDPCGSHYVKNAKKHTLDWFLEAEHYRHQKYAPWMRKEMEFANFAGKNVLEIGGGMGTDLAQFAKYGAHVFDLDLSWGHLNLAKENFSHRKLNAAFTMGDAESIPFADSSFDLVYTNGVIHHSPNTHQIISEIFRVLKPGGVAKVMVYAENSLHYWRNLVLHEWINKKNSEHSSIGEVMSNTVEISLNNAKPLVKVYTGKRLREMFHSFDNVKVVKRQLIKEELPLYLRWTSPHLLSKLVGWNLILTATKPGKLTHAS